MNYEYEQYDTQDDYEMPSISDLVNSDYDLYNQQKYPIEKEDFQQSLAAPFTKKNLPSDLSRYTVPVRFFLSRKMQCMDQNLLKRK